MDLYTSLAVGGTLYCLEKSVQSDYQALMAGLQESGASVWVSTPSFAELCLSERRFAKEWMPQLELFLFCGETLGNRTVRKLQERFPDAKIVNTYGPTESTVAVTEVLVTPQLESEEDPLPVGRAKAGTRLEIWDTDGTPLPEGEKGEIIILGNTVSTGYYNNQELTRKAFFQSDAYGRGYHTGDKGYLKNGMLYYCGRIDLQIKLHGYRIELEDIENNIRKLPGIEHAVVMPNSRGGKVSSLTAYVVEREYPQDEAAESMALRKGLLQFLPEYMVPKKFVFLEQMPMTNNGKADRKLLGGMKR
jgi:D-alanine--poly(phosphoribitol) ligase subunit 1